MKIQPVTFDEALFSEAVELLRQGKLDRPAAAAHAGMKLTTFQTYLRRRGLLEGLKHTRKTAQPRPDLAEKDPEKIRQYQEAIATVLAGKSSINAAGKRFPLVNTQVLGRKVRAVRAAG